ncbi:hypothetical protein PVK06_049498 [Gossypium arboreum]|uniref:Uncharacterized protein n=1 Tax=Gossypium arboreum TaxID=29729 RepID=A0ABR0MJB6_GOSAR|nr:hypothetical protein PVK06_049498 [Gossypium arboreum]
MHKQSRSIDDDSLPNTITFARMVKDKGRGNSRSEKMSQAPRETRGKTTRWPRISPPPFQRPKAYGEGEKYWGYSATAKRIKKKKER